MVLVLLLGRFAYREHLNWAGWLACMLGVIGLCALSAGQAAQ